MNFRYIKLDIILIFLSPFIPHALVTHNPFVLLCYAGVQAKQTQGTKMSIEYICVLLGATISKAALVIHLK